jgi:hypothetical protein
MVHTFCWSDVMMLEFPLISSPQKFFPAAKGILVIRFAQTSAWTTPFHSELAPPTPPSPQSKPAARIRRLHPPLRRRTRPWTPSTAAPARERRRSQLPPDAAPTPARFRELHRPLRRRPATLACHAGAAVPRPPYWYPNPHALLSQTIPSL